MAKTLMGAVVMAVLLPVGISAQAHNHGAQPQSAEAAQPSDAPQGMMQQMQERMQGMQQMMQQMHGAEQDGAQAMRNGQGVGAQAQGAPHQTCIMSGPQAGLSALLLGSASDLALTDAQRSQLQEILAQAQSEALQALTEEQRDKLESAPAPNPPPCPQGQATQGGAD
jgi:DNA-binding protein YbaB